MTHSFVLRLASSVNKAFTKKKIAIKKNVYKTQIVVPKRTYGDSHIENRLVNKEKKQNIKQ